MQQPAKFTAVTLRSYSEALRRELYDAVVKHLWTPDDHGDYVPPYTPDAAQLTVSYDHGRWLVTYLDLDEPTDAPPDRRESMSRVLADPDRPFGIMLSEI